MEVLLHDLVKIFVDRLVEVVNRKQVVTRVGVEEPLCAETPILHPYSSKPPPLAKYPQEMRQPVFNILIKGMSAGHFDDAPPITSHMKSACLQPFRQMGNCTMPKECCGSAEMPVNLLLDLCHFTCLCMLGGLSTFSMIS